MAMRSSPCALLSPGSEPRVEALSESLRRPQRRSKAHAQCFSSSCVALHSWQALVENSVSMNLREAVDLAAALQPVEVGPDLREAAIDFVQRRLEQLLVDGGVPVEAVRAVLRVRGNDPALAARSALELKVGGTVSSLAVCLPAHPSTLLVCVCVAICVRPS
jgi:hypothetical protein